MGVQAVSTDKNLIGRTLKIKIKNIKITDKNKKIEITFPDVEVEGIPIKSEFENVSESIKTKELFSTVFPSPGLYWLELEVESLDENIIETKEIETAQRQLNNRPGTGWSKEDKKNFLKQPILVVDSSAMYQAKINRTILFLTLAMLALTAFAEIIDPLKIYILIKLTAIFGLLVFLLVWYYDP